VKKLVQDRTLIIHFPFQYQVATKPFCFAIKQNVDPQYSIVRYPAATSTNWAAA
jgi:hypothetical protein